MLRTWIKDTTQHVGQEVLVNGWGHRIRQMGDKLVFVDLRDGSGLVQVVFYKPDLDEATQATVDQLKSEFVLEIVGVVNKRGEKQINPELVTGTIEVGAKLLRILNKAKTLPFEIDRDTSNINEEVRLKHRYLDLRSERLQRNIRLRSQWVQACREYIFSKI